MDTMCIQSITITAMCLGERPQIKESRLSDSSSSSEDSDDDDNSSSSGSGSSTSSSSDDEGPRNKASRKNEIK